MAVEKKANPKATVTPKASKLADLEARKLDVIFRMRQVKAEMAKINSDLRRSGASAVAIECWE